LLGPKDEKEVKGGFSPMEVAILADFGAFLTGTAGTIAWNLCVFIAGGVFGPTVWNWAKKYMPWNK